MNGSPELCFEEQLIAEIKNIKCLYDKRSGSYRNTLLKSKKWKEIGEKLGVSDEMCQKKWKVLRDRYTRELRKKNLPSGSGVSLYIEWELMPNLSFLSDVPTTCTSRGNTTISSDSDLFSEETQDAVSTEQVEVEELRSPTLKKSKKEKQDNIEKKFDAILTKCGAEINEAHIGVNELFSQTIGTLLDDLPVELQEDTRLYILTYVTNLKKKVRLQQKENTIPIIIN